MDSAPGLLDTLTELAAALGDDPNFATTVTNAIAEKLSLAGGTMTGAINMNTYKIENLGDATAGGDALSRDYADTRYYLNTTKLNSITLPDNHVSMNS